MLQKADLVTPAQELQTQQSADVHQAAWTPAYVDLISTARGARPLPLPSGARNPNDTAAAGLSGQTQMSFVPRGFYGQTVAIQLLPYRLNRSYLLIQNKDTVNDLLINFGTSADATDSLKLGPGAVYEPYKVPVDPITVIATAANTLGYIIEGFEAPLGAQVLPAQRMLNAPIAAIDSYPGPQSPPQRAVASPALVARSVPGRLMYYGYDMSQVSNQYPRGRKYAVSSVGGQVVRTWVQ